MGFYEQRILPRLIHFGMRQKQLALLREQLVLFPGAATLPPAGRFDYTAQVAPGSPSGSRCRNVRLYAPARAGCGRRPPAGRS